MNEIIRVDNIEASDLMQEHLFELTEWNREIMERAIRNSTRIWVGICDKNIVAIWGLVPPSLMSDTAYLWLYTTKHLQNHTFIFIRHSQRAVKVMLDEFQVIVGHTEIKNRKALQWLRWLGAEFGEPINGTVLPFTIRAKQWQQDSAQSA